MKAWREVSKEIFSEYIKDLTFRDKRDNRGNEFRLFYGDKGDCLGIITNWKKYHIIK